jgi:hypothetical protein
MNGIPSVGLYRTDRHLYYRDGVGPVPGVTTVLREMNKPAIIEWAKRETARCAVDNYDFVSDLIVRGGKPAAAAWLASIPDYIRDTAADIGSSVHRLAEDISRDRKVDISDEQLPFLDGYRNFLADYEPKFLSLERMVWSDRGYGGTYDWIARIDARRILGDTKTSKAVYAEVALQLAGLGFADHIGLTNDPKHYPIPAMDGFAVLHIRPELYARGYRLIEVDVTRAEFDLFCALLSAYRWRQDRAKAVIGEQIPVPVREEAIA